IIYNRVDTQLARLQVLKNRGWQARQALDIGAHKGDWATTFRRVFPDAQIFMIEADRRHEPSLKAVGFPYRIQVVGRSDGTVRFHTLENPGISQGASIFQENTAIYELA